MVVDRVHLGLEADHGHAVAVGPHAHAIVLEHGVARWCGFAQHRVGETLAPVHRQSGTRQLGVLGRAVASLGRMHALAAVEHPVGQGRIAHRLAGHDVIGDPLRHLLPAGSLPGLERPQRPAIAPADGQVDITRGSGDVIEVEGTVVEQVTERGPQEARLWMLTGAKPCELLGGIR